jgi:Tfp pilus assembly protein PilN
MNLLPSDAREEKRSRFNPVQVGVVVAAVAVVAALAYGFFSERSEVTDLTAEKARLQAAIQAAQQQAAPPLTTPSGEPLAGEQALRATALSEVLATRTAWDRVMRGVALVMPEDTWLKGMTGNGSSTDPALATAPIVASVNLLGYSRTQEGVAQLLARLRTIPEIGSVQLGSASLTELGAEDVYEFSVTMTLRSALDLAALGAASSAVPGSAPPPPAAPPAPAAPTPAPTEGGTE